MAVKAGWYTPMLHVRDMQASMRFYGLLGFELVDQMGEGGAIGWARMHCEGGALMFLLAEEDQPPVADRVLFVMYTPDLPGLRQQLLASGIDAPEIQYPGHSPSGSLDLCDPDGYIVSVVHWSNAEHEVWERERKVRISAPASPGGPPTEREGR
jgi:catechol 2,3-dioxygenase-like lactoylglutathione lyase family enzyme